MDKKELFRKLPAVEEILNEKNMQEKDYPRKVKLDSIRETIEYFRNKILSEEDENLVINKDIVLKKAEEILHYNYSSSLQKVINGTGTILHTNLGRSLLSPAIKDEVWEIASGYSNLEYDLKSGKRGSRYSHVTKMIRQLLDVEDVLIVNNNAAAVLLVLNTFAENEEVIVSRGELVEVGGAFRIPSVMEMSSAKLVEVGSTNKTRISDYEKAITEDTRLLMKVHTSNYKLIGFTETVPNEELNELGKKYDIPVVEDLGSGVLLDLENYGLKHEPTVMDSIKSGIDLITFSGDKLLGGPQAGIIVGKKEYIDEMKSNQLLRALRIDKITLASLEATLKLYLDEEKAKETIPTVRMMSYSKEELEKRAEELKNKIDSKNMEIEIFIEDEYSTIGGGSMPGEVIPTKVIVLSTGKFSSSKLEKKLRLSKSHIIGRINEDKFMLDLRTIQDDEFDIIADEIENIFK